MIENGVHEESGPMPSSELMAELKLAEPIKLKK